MPERFQVKLRKKISNALLRRARYLGIVKDLRGNVNQTRRLHRECMESGYLVVCLTGGYFVAW